MIYILSVNTIKLHLTGNSKLLKGVLNKRGKVRKRLKPRINEDRKETRICSHQEFSEASFYTE